MMSVKILGFGSSWWARFGRNPADPWRYTRHATYYNSAGVRCGQKVRRHWLIPGLIRFNGNGDFNPHVPDRAIGETFRCSDVAFACGGNRILFVERSPGARVPDRYLVVASSVRLGIFDFETSSWKSELVEPISVSQFRDNQEALMLMRVGDWVRTKLGVWQFTVHPGLQNGATLRLVEDSPIPC